MNAVSEPIQDLFDLELELVEESVSAGAETRCLKTAYQSTCGGPRCFLQG